MSGFNKEMFRLSQSRVLFVRHFRSSTDCERKIFLFRVRIESPERRFVSASDVLSFVCNSKGEQSNTTYFSHDFGYEEEEQTAADE